MLETSETFGKYTLEARIALGGMAEVFRATTRGRGGEVRTLAIKRLHHHLSEDNELVQMLVQEAKLAVQLNHPNVARTYDLGKVASQYFIVMEFIEGSDLYQLLMRLNDRNALLPTPLALFVVAEALAGLEYAHNLMAPDGQAMDLVHRDVSPQNVMVTFDGRIKLVDFGIAKARMRLMQTRAGIIKGKFYYMAPEQAYGNRLDKRADLFAAGMVLYELLCGMPAYEDIDEVTLLKRVRMAEFPPLSHRRADIDPELERLVHCALERDPNNRYESAQQFRDALLDYLIRRFGQVPTRQQLSHFICQAFGRNVPQVPQLHEVPRQDAASEDSLIFELELPLNAHAKQFRNTEELDLDDVVEIGDSHLDATAAMTLREGRPGDDLDFAQFLPPGVTMDSPEPAPQIHSLDDFELPPQFAPPVDDEPTIAQPDARIEQAPTGPSIMGLGVQPDPSLYADEELTAIFAKEDEATGAMIVPEHHIGNARAWDDIDAAADMSWEELQATAALPSPDPQAHETPQHDSSWDAVPTQRERERPTFEDDEWGDDFERTHIHNGHQSAPVHAAAAGPQVHYGAAASSPSVHVDAHYGDATLAPQPHELNPLNNPYDSGPLQTPQHMAFQAQQTAAPSNGHHPHHPAAAGGAFAPSAAPQHVPHHHSHPPQPQPQWGQPQPAYLPPSVGPSSSDTRPGVEDPSLRLLNLVDELSPTQLRLIGGAIALVLAVVIGGVLYAAVFDDDDDSGQQEIVKVDDVKAATAAVVETTKSKDVVELDVVSVPTNAQILLDGKETGTTPSVLQLERGGTHTVSLVKEGYLTVNREVDAAALPEGLQIELKRAKGVLRITTVPLDAIIELDGVKRGKSPQIVRDLNMTKSYTVIARLDRDGKKKLSKKMQVTWKKGDDLVKSVKLVLDPDAVTSAPAPTHVANMDAAQEGSDTAAASTKKVAAKKASPKKSKRKTTRKRPKKRRKVARKRSRKRTKSSSGGGDDDDLNLGFNGGSKSKRGGDDEKLNLFGSKKKKKKKRKKKKKDEDEDLDLF